MGKIDIKARDAKIKQYEKFSQELSKTRYKGLKGFSLYLRLFKDKMIGFDPQGITFSKETKKG